MRNPTRFIDRIIINLSCVTWANNKLFDEPPLILFSSTISIFLAQGAELKPRSSGCQKSTMKPHLYQRHDDSFNFDRKTFNESGSLRHECHKNTIIRN